MELRKALRDPWVWGQIGLVLLIAVGAPLIPRHINLGPADFMLNRLDPPRIRWLGIPLLVAGLLLMGWAARALGRNLTPGIEPIPNAELVTGGPYAHLRHPMYAGAVLVLAGYALVWSNWTLALLVGVIARVYFSAKARAEERWLRERFRTYQSYMAHVSRRLL